MMPFRVLAALALASLASPSISQESAAEYAFERFVGTWKLKEDRFQQVWDGETLQTLSIPGHRTQCAPVNTDKSILCEVDAVDFKGHILWAVNGNGDKVSHLSQFGAARIGNGIGGFSENGDLLLRIAFSDEPAGTYRVYSYDWVSDNEYVMRSDQYDANGKATGNWYGGSFVRVAMED